MGLDIITYKNAKYVKPFTSWDGIDEYLVNVSNEAFPLRLGGMKPGLYKANEGEHFRAGSYSGYNCWRDDLCKLIYGISAKEWWNTPMADSTMPFAELINMADNEGDIGTSVCAKLAQDFKDHEEQLQTSDLDEYWKDRAECWANAFAEAGENNGFVKFC